MFPTREARLRGLEGFSFVVLDLIVRLLLQLLQLRLLLLTKLILNVPTPIPPRPVPPQLHVQLPPIPLPLNLIRVLLPLLHEIGQSLIRRRFVKSELGTDVSVTEVLHVRGEEAVETEDATVEEEAGGGGHGELCAKRLG